MCRSIKTLRRPEGPASDLNRRLVEQLADGTVADDPGTIATSLHNLIAA